MCVILNLLFDREMKVCHHTILDLKVRITAFKFTCSLLQVVSGCAPTVIRLSTSMHRVPTLMQALPGKPSVDPYPQMVPYRQTRARKGQAWICPRGHCHSGRCHLLPFLIRTWTMNTRPAHNIVKLKYM